MKTITAVIPDELEEKLRQFTKRKGDLSKIVIEALEDWIKKETRKR